MTGAPKPLAVRDLTCRYGGAIALSGASFDVAAGEFVSVLGPSGCGKSTLLRAIAGLEPAAEGRIEVGGRDVAGLRPKDRQVAFVFQSYALYPHMSVRQNLAAPLAMAELTAAGRTAGLWRLLPGQRRARASIDARVAATAGQLEIGPYLDRRPAALSGGQRQRVALGRALIREPDLFLLDEPLANLDAALRHRTRTELRALQRRTGATTLFVTHDQSEAMAISDRVIVMFDGRIRQVGTPDELYRAPADLEVAGFLSQPHLNVIPAAAVRAAIGDRTRAGEISVAGRPLAEVEGVIAFRPEHASIRRPDAPGLPGLRVVVDHVEHGGAEANLFARLASDGTPCLVRIASADIADWPPGAEGVMHFSLADAHLFAGAAPPAPAGRAAA